MNVHEQFVFHGKNAKKSINECKMLLPEIERQRIWHEKGFGSIYEYAAKLAGLSHGQVDDALWILKKIENKPALMKVAHEKSLSSVRPTATIATQETQKSWASKARKMSKHTLQLHVREFRSGTKNQAQTIEMNLSQKTMDELKTLKGDSDWESLMRELLEARKKLQEQKKPQKIENAGRNIPKAIEKWVIKTTNGQCSEPSCYKKYDVLHHEDYFALTKTHDPDRIIPLCKGHHELKHNYANTPEQYFVNQKMFSFARAP